MSSPKIKQSHAITTFAATIVTSDEPGYVPGDVRYLAICSCGWWVRRQLAHAVGTQVGKHLDEVA